MMDIIAKPSPNYNDRRDNKQISMLIMHYTGMRNGDAALERLCDPDAQVSAHYVVDEMGQLYQLVDEEKRAWHAGQGFWRGERDINSASIGIEIVNPGHEFGYRPFPDRQMKAVMELARGIVARHKIAPINVVGHSDIAPLRKEDPGELFDWRFLAENGIGLWAEPTISAIKDDTGLAEILARIGYEIEDLGQLPLVIAAFQRHWRPLGVTGQLDPETANIATAVQNAVKSLT